MGASPLSSAALRLFVDDLEPLSDQKIQTALVRCRREIGGNGYAPTLTIKDVLDRAGVVTQQAQNDAECRAAWDALMLYADKHIVSDPEGNYGKRRYFGMKPAEIPDLDQRTADTLRRIGGWKQVKTMTEDDLPFVQKRFYEEYRAWRATETVLLAKALDGNQAFKELVDGKRMPDMRRITDKASV